MYATVLWFLLFLFCLRVAGQALVAAFAVPFLPPMKQWYSGVIPYPILLPVQILIICLLAKVATDFTRRRGFFVVPRRSMGRLLQWFSYLYWGAMAVRYVASMALHPERRWFGGTIPIFFHCVLALFITQDFRAAVVFYLPATVFLLVVLSVAYARARERRILVAIAGLGLMFIAAGVQQARIALHPTYFNHNALYHLIQAVALWLFFLGLRRPHADAT